MFIEFSSHFFSSSSILNVTKKKHFCKGLRAYYEGKHVVYISYKSLEMSKKFVDDDFHKMILNHLAKNIPDLSSLKDKVSAYIKISDRNETFHNEISIDGGDIHHNFFEKFVHIGESLVDVEFYESMSRLFLKNILKINIFKIVSQRVPGGGASTYKVILDNSNEGKIVLCNVDSDRKAAHLGIGQTALNVKKNKYSTITRYNITECRESENYITIQLLDHLINCLSNKYSNNIQTLEALKKQYKVCSDFWYYQDLKEVFKDSLLEDFNSIFDKIPMKSKIDTISDSKADLKKILLDVASWGISPPENLI